MKLYVFTVFVIASLLSAGPQASTGSIEGVVLRLGTTDPIAGVNVEMRRVEGTPAFPLLPPVFLNGMFSPGAMVLPNSPNPADAFYATTGSDGAFRFPNLKPGKYRLLAAHPEGAYYPAEYGQRNPRGPGYDFGIDGASSMKVHLEMAPMASISGRVTGADGKPAAHAHVLAAEIAFQNGVRVLNQIQGVEADERGNYRLFWLPPGKYYVGAIPEGIRRKQITVPFGPPAQVESLNQYFSQPLIQYRTGSNGEVLREVYDIVYSPGVTNPDAATAIDLRLGSNVSGIDIALAPGRHRAVRIRGSVIDAGGQPAKNTSVQAIPLNTRPITVSPTTRTDATGAFEIDGVMQGNYLLTASIVDGNSRSSAIQYLAVESSDIAQVNLAVTAGLKLSGHITLDGFDTNAYRVSLTNENIVAPSYGSGNVPSSQFSISGISPGNYRVSAFPFNGGTEPATYVKSIRFGGAELTTGMLQITDSPSGILEIALGRNGGIAEGTVLDTQRQPSVNVVTVLVPADSRRPDLYKTATTDLSGHFQIPGVAPGTYFAFAWPWLPSGIWRDPEFLRSVEARGTRITISEGSNRSIELALLPEVNF